MIPINRRSFLVSSGALRSRVSHAQTPSSCGRAALPDVTRTLARYVVAARAKTSRLVRPGRSHAPQLCRLRRRRFSTPP
jgi:hypothetical protein